MISFPSGFLPRRSRRWFATIAVAAFVMLLGNGLRAMTVRVPTFSELVAGSGQIVRGRVVRVEAVDRTAPDGRPFVKTRVTWSVESRLKGTENSTLTLEFLGGKSTKRELHVPGMPKFVVGETEYLFVESNTEIVCPVFAGGHGRYYVAEEATTGRRYVTRGNRVPLTDAAQVSEPLGNAFPAVLAARTPADALTVEAFESAVRSELARANGGQHAE